MIVDAYLRCTIIVIAIIIVITLLIKLSNLPDNIKFLNIKRILFTYTSCFNNLWYCYRWCWWWRGNILLLRWRRWGWWSIAFVASIVIAIIIVIVIIVCNVLVCVWRLWYIFSNFWYFLYVVGDAVCAWFLIHSIDIIVIDAIVIIAFVIIFIYIIITSPTYTIIISLIFLNHPEYRFLSITLTISISINTVAINSIIILIIQHIANISIIIYFRCNVIVIAIIAIIIVLITS